MEEKLCKRIEEEEETHMLRVIIQCAEFILPLLQPPELSSLSSTCKTLNHIAKSITAVRSSDASRNFENFPIPFINTVDDQPYAYFLYTPTQTLVQPDPYCVRQQWGSKSKSNPNVRLRPDPDPIGLLGTVLEDASGCDCETCGGDLGCPCSWLTRECGASCLCELECGNRLSQRGVAVQLKIVKNQRKGWGLHAYQSIRCGQFICEYAGELLTTKEARTRQDIYDRLASCGRFSSALLIVREHLPSGNACMRINIDATKIGNVARFINHSCDGGNLSTVLVRSLGALLPRVCFFASRDILEDEELTFSYGDTSLKPKGLQCFCGSSCCSGIMPSENT